VLCLSPMHLTSAEKKAVLTGIGAEIRRRRRKPGISQGALARKAGVHCNVVGRIERGKYNPSVMTLDAIAHALNTSIADLLRRAFK
jgi:transcriptional regulator with XRE-family HTH domain